MVRRQLGDVLITRGNATLGQITEALRIQRDSEEHARLGRILVESGVIDEPVLAAALAELHGLDSVNLEALDVDTDVARTLTRSIAMRHAMVPIEVTADHITVAVADPVDVFALDDLRARLPDRRVTLVVATADQIRHQLAVAWGEEEHRQAVASFEADVEGDGLVIEAPETDEGAAALVTQLLRTADLERASDLHIEPQSDQIRVRIRVDGVMKDLMHLPKGTLSSITARIKIISGLDVFERRLPQDGRTRLRIQDHQREVRVSTLPTVHGEKIVMRLLPTQAGLPAMASLGFTPEQAALMRSALNQPQGLILVTGPTGSGKSNTLYAALLCCVNDQRNVITVEDPVEVEIDGIAQVAVSDTGVLTFEGALRAALRQDPDVLLVGEIRDPTTGSLALRASLTGHLVLSTLHTLDAPSAIVRLLDLGLPRYLAAASLNLIVSQRLIRKNCASCAAPSPPSAEISALLGIAAEEASRMIAGTGCPACSGTGYRGRMAVFELLQMTNEFRSMVGAGADEHQLRESARAAGWKPLLTQALRLAVAGATTADEVLRVVTVPEDTEALPQSGPQR